MGEEYESGLVSVIVPTYNRVHFLSDAMDSVWNQSYRPIELLIVDDGSTDNTPDTVKQWAKARTSDRQFHLRYLAQENRGAPAARNLGLIESQGEFIQWLDSDDILHPEKLTSQVAELQRAVNLDFVYSATAQFTEQPDWNADPIAGRPADMLLPAYIAGVCWWTHGGLYRRSACRTLGPWAEELTCCQDWEYNLRFLTLRPKIGHVPGTLSLVRCHATGNLWASAATAVGLESRIQAVQHVEAALSAADLLDAPCREALGKQCVTIAYLATKNGHDRVSRRAVARGLRLARSPACRAKLLALRVIRGLPRRLRGHTCALLGGANVCANVLRNGWKSFSRVRQTSYRHA